MNLEPCQVRQVWPFRGLNGRDLSFGLLLGALFSNLDLKKGYLPVVEFDAPFFGDNMAPVIQLNSDGLADSASILRQEAPLER